MNVTRQVRLPNGSILTWLRRDIVDAALGKKTGRDPDFVTLYKTADQAQFDAIRIKLDRVNVNLGWLRVLLVMLIVAVVLT